MSLKHIRGKTITLLAVLLVSGLSSPAFSGDSHNSAFQAILEREVFTYTVTHGNDTPIGELEVNVSNQGHAVLVISSLRISNALARLFLDEYIIRNRFHVDHGQLVLVSGEARRPGSPEIVSSYVVDRERGVIQYPDQESITVSADMKFDTLDFPIMMSTADPESLAGTSVLIVGHKKTSLYHYEAPQEETITWQGKQYDALKVTRNKSGESGRQVSVWLTNDAKRIPLRIASSKRGMDSIFELKEPPGS